MTIDRHKLGKASRNKGKSYEREIAKELQKYGYDAHRSQQYCGANSDADVVGLPGIHIECKRREKVQIYDWMNQSAKESSVGDIPVVMFRTSNHKTLVTLSLDDFMKLYNKAYKERNDD
jgi:hypothetical protein